MAQTNQYPMTKSVNEEIKGARTCAHIKDFAKEVKLLVTPDELSAYLIVKIENYISPVLSQNEIEMLIKKANIRHGIDIDKLNEFIEGIETVGVFGPHLIAEGRQARHGKDGYLQFFIYPDKADADDSKIDYKKTDNIINVHKDQKIGELVPPIKCEDGINVFGRIINATGGNPGDYKTGKNVRFEESDQAYYAECNGHLEVTDKVLTVLQEYVVKNDVDYSTGNINFSEKVVIFGNILPDFKVYGGKSIQVDGLVEAAELSSDGDITIRSGVYCKDKGSIQCKGDFSAKFFNDGYLACDGNVTILSEIVNSDVKVLGNIDISNGTILGGSVIALGGIEARNIGSDLGVATTVGAGINFRIQDQLRDIDEEIQKITAQMDKLNRSIGSISILKDPKRLARLSDQRKKALQKTLEDIQNLHRNKEELYVKRNDLEKVFAKKAEKRIRVNKILHHGTVVLIGDYSIKIEEDHTGPLILYEDKKERAIKISGA